MASCGGCPREWSGAAEAHCSMCHQHFASANLFDRHIVAGEGICIHPTKLRGRNRLVLRKQVVAGHVSRDKMWCAS